MQLNHKVKRWIIHVLDSTVWRWRVTDKELHMTKGAALHKLDLFEKTDKFNGVVNTYKIVCVYV